jgi:curved DNA-binding protein CbpA
MKLYHPDSLNKEIESEVYLKAQEINEAYEVLSKPSLREVYHQDFLEYSQREVKKGHLFSFQYLKSYEKDLLKREAELKKKQQALKVKKTTLTPYSITLEQYEALKDLAFEFDHSNRELHLNKIIEKLKNIHIQK